jgi:hypothetical protein
MVQKRFGICLVGPRTLGRAHGSAYRRISGISELNPEINLQSIVELDDEETRAAEGARFLREHIIPVTNRAFDDSTRSGTDESARRRDLGLDDNGGN